MPESYPNDHQEEIPAMETLQDKGCTSTESGSIPQDTSIVTSVPTISSAGRSVTAVSMTTGRIVPLISSVSSIAVQNEFPVSSQVPEVSRVVPKDTFGAHSLPASTVPTAKTPNTAIEGKFNRPTGPPALQAGMNLLENKLQPPTGVVAKKAPPTGFRPKKDGSSSNSPPLILPTVTGSSGDDIQHRQARKIHDGGPHLLSQPNFESSMNSNRPMVVHSGQAQLPVAVRPISVAGAAVNMKQPNQQTQRMQRPTGMEGGNQTLRELKVEDALQYLDQVKLEFGDNPTVYNHFLEIMKLFKSQELDTPGVIKRVSALFRGYNKLILGFNTFLPEGYKIELKDLETTPVRPDVQGNILIQDRNTSVSSHQPQQQVTEVKVAAPVSRPLQKLEVADVNHTPTSDAVKKQGSMQPIVSNEAVATPASANVTSSSNRLPGTIVKPYMGEAPYFPYRIQTSKQQGRPKPNPTVQQPLPATASVHLPMVPNSNVMRGHLQQAVAAPKTGNQVHRPPVSNVPSNQSQPPQVEFDAAIAYVTTIKQRFANEPRIYQQFLEILHTYQQEQRGIREVLEQVSTLFADHPDLLRQFAFFLPEAVQEQAREKLQWAAAEAEARNPKIRVVQTHNAIVSPSHAVISVPESTVVSSGTTNVTETPKQGQKIIDMTQQPSSVDTSMLASPAAQRKVALPFDNAILGAPSSQFPSQPDSFVYNAGVERQFFDNVKEALTSSYSRNGETAWAEFLKCVDLYAQEILSRNEMLSMIEDLLGKKNSELFEEFKSILTYAGADNFPSQDDSWHSVPLSEIDFNRCRRCTPSYRALPRDYPSPPCSDRSEEEFKVLNHVWVSLPVGSEETNRFRHMRKNQYEEILFRCEDERFEIDMVIDSNYSTLRRLEPIAEEIFFLQQQKSLAKDALSTVGNLVFQYSFDKTVLNTIHKNCIARIYGDAGTEILDLMLKNPVVVVPIIVKRLQQKDREFREAKEALNRRWKELAELNYYKSVDHRSLTWRTADKRNTSTRSLIAEIKDRAANKGLESEASITARRDKAKEEHGNFYDFTMGRYIHSKTVVGNIPKPCKIIFTPHLSIMYNNNSWAQKDACRLLCFLVERGSTSPGDKERCYKLWRDFLCPLFGLNLIWMQAPVASFSVSSNDITDQLVKSTIENENDDENDESSIDEKDMLGFVNVKEEVIADYKERFASRDHVESSLLDHQPIPSGAHLSTLYGEGTLIEYRRLERTYVVSLSFGATAYLRPNAVLCSILHPERSSLTEDLRSKDSDSLGIHENMLCFGPQSLYMFFRLHNILVRRLTIAHELAYAIYKDESLKTIAENLSEASISDSGRLRYDAFLSLVYSLVEGGFQSIAQGGSVPATDGVKYEDRLRCLLGHGAYELSTMDKLLSHILKCLQNMANDEVFLSMVQVFRRHLSAGSFKPIAFRQEVAILSEGETIFAFQYTRIPNTDCTVMHIEYMGSLSENGSEDKGTTCASEATKRNYIFPDRDGSKRMKHVM